MNFLTSWGWQNLAVISDTLLMYGTVVILFAYALSSMALLTSNTVLFMKALEYPFRGRLVFMKCY